MNLRLREQPKLWLVVASGAVCSQALLSLLWPHSFRLTAFGDLLQCVLLLFCLLSVLPNIAQAQGRTRLFWLLIGVGFGTWLGAQVLWTYFEIFLHREVPNPFVGDVVLFLHIVPMMAALALRPHLRQDDPLARLGFLDFALLLTWWLYLFLFVVIPWQYVYPSEAVYGHSFDLLYLSEHLVFLSALLLVWRRSTGQWRIIYAYLLGSATLYAISSIAASVAIDFHVYYTGSLYDVPLVAAVALFSGIGPIARAFAQRNQPATMGFSKASIWAAHLAMAAVFSTPFMIVWALFCGTN